MAGVVERVLAESFEVLGEELALRARRAAGEGMDVVGDPGCVVVGDP
jgi:hypothetical protein